MKNTIAPVLLLANFLIAAPQAGCAGKKTTTAAVPATASAVVADPNLITNGVVEAVISPATGRVTRFGFVGGTNVLWVNPDLRGDEPITGPDWVNFGGDKVWIWPETEWKVRTGAKSWKPVSDPPSRPYTVRRTKTGVVMVSPVIDKFGVRLVREISLQPGQPTMTIVNKFDVVDRRVAANGGPLALWTVTQIPAPKEVIATPVYALADNGQQSKWEPKPLMPDSREPWPLPPQPAMDAPGDVVFKRPTTAGAKVGFDAKELRVQLGDVFLSLEATFAHAKAGTLEPNERAQLYTQPGNETSGERAAYVELEFTSPKWDANDLEHGALTITWTLWTPEK